VVWIAEQLRALSIVVFMALAPILASTANAVPTQATTSTTCARFGTVSVAGGAYAVQQNEWNSSKKQCISVHGTSWTITAADFDIATNGPPATYPSIYRGCHWGNCTTESGLPIRIGMITVARSSWSTTLKPAGAYDVAYDLWTNSRPTTRGQPDGSEIMIWLSSRGAVQPAGSRVATAKIGGASWQVWITRMSGWNYVAYRRTRRTASVRTLNIGAFLKDSVRRGSTKSGWYLIGAEAGFEIWKGGKGLGTRSFSFSAS